MQENPNAHSQPQQKIVFVTGKGGVGKTTVAHGLAKIYAQKNLKTLLVELGEKSELGQIYQKSIGYKPTKIDQNLDLTLWDGEACLREFVSFYVPIDRLVNLFFENKVTQSLLNAAPALKELAILGKITSTHRKIGPPMPYDMVIVDAFSTGHFKALISAPIGMNEAISKGPMGKETRGIMQVISNPQITQYYIVTLPEDLPITETIELHQFIKEHIQMNAHALINKAIVPPLSESELQNLSVENKFEQQLIQFLSTKLSKLKTAQKRLEESHIQYLTVSEAFSEKYFEKLKMIVESMHEQIG